MLTFRCYPLKIYIHWHIHTWTYRRVHMYVYVSCDYICTTVWRLLLDSIETQGEKARWNYTRMLSAILNKAWKQHPTKQQLYGHLPPISQNIQVGHSWRNMDKISDLLLWTPIHVSFLNIFFFITSNHSTEMDCLLARHLFETERT